MSWPACIFCYRGEALTIRWTVEGARDAGFVPVVLDDAADPLPGTAMGWLVAEGVEYRRTAFPRRGNLNGTDTAAAIAGELAAAADRHDSDFALKLDPDTAVMDADLFTQARTAAGVGLVWRGDRRGGAYGLAYALRIDVAAEVGRYLACLPLDAAAPEDLTVWAAARALCGPEELLEHEFCPDGGPWAALPWDARPREWVGAFGVLTVGNEPPEGWKGRRDLLTSSRLRQVVLAGRERVFQRA